VKKTVKCAALLLCLFMTVCAVVIPAHAAAGGDECQHDWGDPVWTWAEDLSAAHVTLTCAHCGETQTVQARLTITATAELDGTRWQDSRSWPAAEPESVAIVRQPVDYVGAIGATSSFTVAAEGDGLTYQWQVNSGSGWANSGAASANDATLKPGKVTEARLAYWYRCIITDAYGNTVTTNEVRMRLPGTALTIVTQPADFIGALGTTATFTVEATGDGLTYQWQVNSGSGWANSGAASANDATLKPGKVTEARLAYLYRCIITDSHGNTVTTDEVRMRLPGAALTIVMTQPTDYVGALGTTATFTVEATGDDLTYQWQVNNGGGWANSGGVGNQTATLTAGKVTQARLTYMYRCIITDSHGNTVTTNEVRMRLPDDGSLRWRMVYYDFAQERYTWDENEAQREIEVWPGHEWIVQVFRTDGQSETLLSAADLTWDPAIMDVQDAEEGLIRLRFLHIGTGRLAYGSSAISVSVTLPPSFGFYRSTMDDADTYLGTWTYDGSEKTIYLVARNGIRMDLVENDCDSDLTITLSDDGRYAAVTVNELRNNWLGVRIAGTWADGTSFGGYDPAGRPLDDWQYWDVRVDDVSPRLCFWWVDRDWDETLGEEVFFLNEGQDHPERYLAGVPRTYYTIQVLFDDGHGNRVAPPIEELSFTNIAAQPVGDGYLEFALVDFGEATISYGDYCLRFDAQLPDIGFYRSAEAAEETYLFDWTYDNSNDTVYLIARDGARMDLIENDCDGDLTITLLNDGSCAAITVNDLHGDWLAVRIAGVWGNGEIFGGYDPTGAELGGWQYQILRVNDERVLRIIQQPEDGVVACEGDTAYVTVKVGGEGLTYEWWYKNAGASKFSKTTAFTSNTYSLAVTGARNGRQLYCVITDQYGNRVTTKTVTLRIADAITVTSEAELIGALNRTERVEAIRIAANFGITSDCTIQYDPAHLPYYADTLVSVDRGVTLTINEGGRLGSFWPSYEGDWRNGPIPNGKVVNNGTIVIEDGGATEADFYLNAGTIMIMAGGEGVCCDHNYGWVTVENGGAYRTSQSDMAVNERGGFVSIAQDAELEACFGTTFVNCGTLQLDGRFRVGADDWNLWFFNDTVNNANVSGSGSIFLYHAAENDVSSLDGQIEAVMEMLGQETRFEDWDDINIYAEYEADSFAELAACFPGDRVVAGEAVEGDLDVIVRLTGDVAVTGELATMGRIVIPGFTLTIPNGASAEASFEVCEGGAICVLPGGALLTTMGGEEAICNRGTITVDAGAELRSQMGGSVANRPGGALILNGSFYCGCIRYDDVDHAWFTNEGVVSGSGEILLYEADPEGGAIADMDALIADVEALLGSGSGIRVMAAQNAGLRIIAQPQNYVGAIGDTASFTVVAGGDGLTYQWQHNAGSKWANSGASGNKTPTLRIGVTETRLGYRYRCIITDAGGSTLTTDEVRMVLGYTRADDDEVYEEVLGTFAGLMEGAAETGDINERYARYAKAEAALLDSAVMIPTTASGGSYVLSRIAPHTVPYVQWGSDDDRLFGMVISDAFLTKQERSELLALWEAAVAGGAAYDPAAYLTGKGHTLQTTYTTAFSTALYTLDWLDTSARADTEILVNLADGLMQYDNLNRLQPALAERWEVSDDGLTYTFHIRPGAYWYTSAGAQYAEVTAADFAAGFRHMLDTQSGLVWLVDGVIAGASDYLWNNGSWADVGCKATDRYILTFTLERPTPYFMTMLGYSCFLPICDSFYQSCGGVYGVAEFASARGEDSYTYGIAGDVTSQVYCGPFRLTACSGDEITLSRNAGYYNASAVTLDTITWVYDSGADADAVYDAAVAGTYASIGLNGNTLERAQQDGYFDACAYVSETTATTYFGGLNVNRGTYALENGNVASPKSEQQKIDTAAALRNRNFRKALQFAFDRGAYNAVARGEDLKYASLRNMYTHPEFVSLAEAVTLDGHTFAAGTFYGEMVQYFLNALGCPITVDDGQDGWYDPAAARQYLAAARQELGASAGWPITIDVVYFSASASSTMQAQAYKQSIEAALGTENIVVHLIAAETSSDYYASGYRAASGADGNFDMFYGSGWGPDYGDPSTYLDTFCGYGFMTRVIGLY